MRSRRPQNQSEELVGHDSFLDVVSNLIGILVILITVIGIGARGAHVTAANKKAVDRPMPGAVEASRAVALNLQQDIEKTQRELATMDLAVQSQRSERDAMLARMAYVRQSLLREQSGIDRHDQERLKMLQVAEERRDRLADLSKELESLKQPDETPQTLLHDMTPIAETVYGTEQHLRLLGGRLDYVPLNELVERLKEDAARNAWRLKDTPEMTETLGPIDGYFLQYTLTLQEEPAMTPQGPAIQRMVALDKFVLIPVDGRVSQSLTEQLNDDSELAQRLRGFEPGTTLTVWTYPDSYAEFRQLRDWLGKRGFRAAARPLPAGELIAGSPRGTRSAAQ
ncbi:MAG: hypothetical protein O3C60_14490 [Planctomycetota bacterium]|nr:hypothetical protein [Planctomycetota bacterium]